MTVFEWFQLERFSGSSRTDTTPHPSAHTRHQKGNMPDPQELSRAFCKRTWPTRSSSTAPASLMPTWSWRTAKAPRNQVSRRWIADAEPGGHGCAKWSRDFTRRGFARSGNHPGAGWVIFPAWMGAIVPLSGTGQECNPAACPRLSSSPATKSTRFPFTQPPIHRFFRFVRTGPLRVRL